MAIEGERFGSVEVEVALDFERLERQKASELPAKMRQVGARSADGFVQGLEQQYQRRMGEAREELVRGLISPKEFERRGREAAQAMNKGILQELERRGKAGQLGRAYTQDFNTLTGAFKNVGAEGKRGAAGVGEMRESFASLLAQAAGVHPVLGRIVNVMGGLAVGSVFMGAVLAGLSALAFAWSRISEKAREAKEEQESARAAAKSRLEAILREEQLGPRGETGASIETRREEQREIARQQQEIRDKLRQGSLLSVAAAEADIAALQARYDAIEETIQAGERSITAAQTEASEAEIREAEAAWRRVVAKRNEIHREREEQARKEEQAASRLAQASGHQGLTDATLRRLGLSGGALGDTVERKLQAIAKLEREIVSLEADSALLGGDAPPEAAAFIEAQRRRVQAMREEVERALPGLAAASEALTDLVAKPFVDMPFMKEGGGLGFVGQSMAELDRLFRSVAEAETELNVARRNNQPERAAAAEERLKVARAALRDSTAALARNLEKAGLPAKKLKELLGEIDAILAEAGVDVADFGDQMSKWEKYGQAATVLTRGLLSVADAAGKVSQETRRAVTGILDILDGLKQVENARGLTGFAQTVGFASGGLAVLGGLLGIGTALFGGREESPESRALREAIESNRRALERNTDVLEGRIAGDTPAASGVRAALEAVEAARAAWEADAETRRGESDPGDPDFSGSSTFDFMGTLREALADLGFTMEDVAELASAFDIDLSAGESAYRQLLDLLARVSAADIANDFAGAMRLLQRQWDLLNVTDPAKKIEDLRKVLARFTSEDFAAQLAGIDFSDPEAVQNFAEAILAAIEAGTFDLSLLGKVSLNDFLDTLSQMAGLSRDGAPGGTTQDFVQARSITTIQASRIEGAMYTQNALMAEEVALSMEGNALLRAIVAGQGLSPSMVSGFMAGGANPSDYAPAQSVGGVTIAWAQNAPLIDGGIQVSGIRDEGIIQEVRDQVMGSVKGGIDAAMDAAAVDRRLGARYRARARDLGRS